MKRYIWGNAREYDRIDWNIMEYWLSYDIASYFITILEISLNSFNIPLSVYVKSSAISLVDPVAWETEKDSKGS